MAGRIGEHALAALLPLEYRRQCFGDDERHVKGAHLIGFRGALHRLSLDPDDAAADTQRPFPHVNILLAQVGRLAPSEAAEAKQQHEGPAFVANVDGVEAFVGECHELRNREIDAPFLAFRLSRQLQPLARVLGDESVLHSPFEHAVDDALGSKHDAGGATRREVADPFLQFCLADFADPPILPLRLHMGTVRGFRALKLAGLPKRLFDGDPLLVEFAESSRPALRVYVAVGGLGDGDVFRSPRLRVNLAAEAPLVGLRAVGFPIADSIPVFAFGRPVSGDVRHDFFTRSYLFSVLTCFNWY